MANLGYIQLVRRCNHRCLFCSNPETSFTLSLEQAFAEVDDFVRRGYDGIILTGGEPSLSEIVEPVVRYALGRGMAVRMITNGSRLADENLACSYVDAGLKHYHVSLYSHRADVHDYITRVAGSLQRATKAIENLGRLGARVNVNTVINRYNADHLDLLAEMVVERFPFVDHMVFNNLDPSMGRGRESRESVPTLRSMELSLHRALRLLLQAGKTFRVERVPLCYMVEFAWASTETRKIVKGEERIVHFLDERGTVHQTNFLHHKSDVCEVCSFREICAGLYAAGDGYDEGELAPVFVDPRPIVGRIRRSEG